MSKLVRRINLEKVVANEPFVLQLSPYPNAVAIQKRTLAFCDQEFA